MTTACPICGQEGPRLFCPDGHWVRTCEECHHEKGYIDFAALGYTPVVVSNLSHISIVKLSEEYNEFHLPTMFDPCVVKGKEDVK